MRLEKFCPWVFDEGEDQQGKDGKLTWGFGECPWSAPVPPELPNLTPGVLQQDPSPKARAGKHAIPAKGGRRDG